MIEPKETVIDGHTYILHKLPAVAGREIVTQYLTANIPKLGDYGRSEELMLKLMRFVTVRPQPGGPEIALETPELIDNHVPGAMTLLKLEKEMMQYSFDFLADGEISNFLELIQKVADRKVTQIAMNLLGVSSTADEQPSGN